MSVRFLSLNPCKELTMKIIRVFSAIGCLLLCFSGCVRQDNYQPGPDPGPVYNNRNNQGVDSASYTYNETFNGTDNYNWVFTSPTDSAYGSIVSNGFQYVDYSMSSFNSSVVYTFNSVSGGLTIRTKIMSNNMMGLVFGASPTDNGYAFYVDSNGYYSLYREGSGSVASTAIIPSTQDTLYAVKKGWNQLEIDQAGGYWTGLINGSQVFQISAQALAGSGFGFKIAPGTVGYAAFLYVNSH
jgi:hypothetical protein